MGLISWLKSKFEKHREEKEKKAKEVEGESLPVRDSDRDTSYWYEGAEGEWDGSPFAFTPYVDPHLASNREAESWYAAATQEFDGTPFVFTPYVQERKPSDRETSWWYDGASRSWNGVSFVFTPYVPKTEKPESCASDSSSTNEVAERSSDFEPAYWYGLAHGEWDGTDFVFTPYIDLDLASNKPAERWYGQAEGEYDGVPFAFVAYVPQVKSSDVEPATWYERAEKAWDGKEFVFTPYVDPRFPANKASAYWYELAQKEWDKVPFNFVSKAVPAPEGTASVTADSQVVEGQSEEGPQGDATQLDDLALYNLGLGKAREGFSHRLSRIAKKYKEANSDYFDELEECLIEADVGVDLSIRLLETTETMAAQQHITDPSAINDLLVDNMFMDYAKQGESYRTDIEFDKDRPTVLMMVGVNGTGKTTTIAKLALRYKEKGKKVMVVAADTFRAGAVDQIRIWADRIGVTCFDKGMGAEPAAVCFDAMHKAIAEKFDLVIVDTAGRLHTKDYLMNELGKLSRVIGKILPGAPQEVWLALDANTGQNGIQQSKVFKEVCHLTGIVITKMDGTSKGGIILAIRDQLGIPVRFIGLGEHEHDLREFDLDKYLYGLLIGGEE